MESHSHARFKRDIEEAAAVMDAHLVVGVIERQRTYDKLRPSLCDLPNP